MIKEERFRGDYTTLVWSVDGQWLDLMNYRFFILNPTVNGLSIYLPYAPMLSVGGPLITLYDFANRTIDIKNFSKQTLFTMPSLGTAKTIVYIYLINNSTSNGTWRWYMRRCTITS